MRSLGNQELFDGRGKAKKTFWVVQLGSSGATPAVQCVCPGFPGRAVLGSDRLISWERFPLPSCCQLQERAVRCHEFTAEIPTAGLATAYALSQQHYPISTPSNDAVTFLCKRGLQEVTVWLGHRHGDTDTGGSIHLAQCWANCQQSSCPPQQWPRAPSSRWELQLSHSLMQLRSKLIWVHGLRTCAAHWGFLINQHRLWQQEEVRSHFCSTLRENYDPNWEGTWWLTYYFLHALSQGPTSQLTLLQENALLCHASCFQSWKIISLKQQSPQGPYSFDFNSSAVWFFLFVCLFLFLTPIFLMYSLPSSALWYFALLGENVSVSNEFI